MCIRDRVRAVPDAGEQFDDEQVEDLSLEALAVAAEGDIPVSYTHLDVYKRQASPCNPPRIAAGNRLVCG